MARVKLIQTAVLICSLAFVIGLIISPIGWSASIGLVWGKTSGEICAYPHCTNKATTFEIYYGRGGIEEVHFCSTHDKIAPNAIKAGEFSYVWYFVLSLAIAIIPLIFGILILFKIIRKIGKKEISALSWLANILMAIFFMLSALGPWIATSLVW